MSEGTSYKKARKAVAGRAMNECELLETGINLFRTSLKERMVNVITSIWLLIVD